MPAAVSLGHLVRQYGMGEGETLEIVWVFNVRKAVRGGFPMPRSWARRVCRVFPSYDWGSFRDAVVPIGKPTRPPYGALAAVVGLAVVVAGLVTLAAVAGSQGDRTRYCQPVNSGQWACSDSPVTVGGSR